MSERKHISVSEGTYHKLWMFAFRNGRTVCGLVDAWVNADLDERLGPSSLCRSGYPRQRSRGVGEDAIA